MPRGLHGRCVSADDAPRLQEKSGFQEASAVVALVSAGSFVPAVRALALHEPVGQEALVVLAVQHLRVLTEDVAILVDFHKGFLHEFLVHWAFGSSVVVEGCAPALEQVGYYGMISIRQLFRRYPLP